MSTDKRRSYRSPVQPEVARACLLVDGKRVPVRIVDQSSGGYLILALPESSLESGAEVVLSSDGGDSRVRVARRSDHEGEIRLGVERLEDLAPPEPSRHAMSLFFRPKSCYHEGNGQLGQSSMSTVMLLLAFAAALFGYVELVQSGWLGGKKSQEEAVEWQLPDPEKKTLSTRLADLGRRSAAWGERVVTEKFDALAALIAPGTANDLDLNEEQQSGVQRIVGESLDSLSQVEGQAGLTSGERSRAALDIFEKAERQIDALLPERQRKAWRSASSRRTR
jgi:hypothetical protein